MAATHADAHKQHAIAHAGATDLIHATMKAAMAKIRDTDVDALPADKLERFTFYMYIFGTFLHEHHDHEEEIFFPDAVAKEPDRMKPIVEQLQIEHKDFIPKIDRLLEITKDTKASIELVKEAREIIISFKESLETHFDVEVRELTPEHFEKYYTDAEMNAQTNKAAKSKAGPTLIIPFILLNLESSKRGFLSNHLPWFVKSFLVPGWLNRHAQVWKDFAAYPTQDANGKLIMVERTAGVKSWWQF